MIHKEANPFHRSMRSVAATAPMAWIFTRTLHHVDPPIFRLTGGRYTFVSLVTGLPVVMLTTTGAQSGKRRTLPVLGLPDGQRMVVIASNYGQANHPSWYHNLLAHPAAEIFVDGTRQRVVAREVEGEERERLWRRGLEVYPGWGGYERRARARRIPVMVLSPEGYPARE